MAISFIFSLFSPFIKANTIFDSDEIRPRFETMECMITPRYTTEVESYIKKYLAYDGAQAKRVMSRAAVYFPIYEKFLTDHGLPQDLKYLSIVESALIPHATSPAGAKGLWQFMSQTGRNYCLSIDKEVDERSCPYNSTEAAMQYLAKQYQRFGSWELAIASYNCGPGTIDKAMRRGRSDNYWTISRYLPRETRNFVPAFLGAVYVGNFYHLHDIEPEYPSLDMQVTEAIKVFEKLDFTTIAALTGLPVEVISELNPAYKKDYIPENTEGYDVILPRRVSMAMSEYLEARRPDSQRKIELPPLPEIVDTANYSPDEQYFRSVYVVAEGDKIEEVAEVFNIAPYNLKVWNKLTSYQLKKGQELAIWFPKEFHHFLPKELRIEVEPLVGAAKIKMVKQVQEEVLQRENVAVPSEMPIKLTLLKLRPSDQSTLQVVTPNLEAQKLTIGEKVGKFMDPIKNVKINLPKVKMPKVTLPKKEKTPKKAPVMPTRKTDEPNGHGLI
jgi:membrane-bound lytic murein transglycosylase D